MHFSLFKTTFINSIWKSQLPFPIKVILQKISTINRPIFFELKLSETRLQTILKFPFVKGATFPILRTLPIRQIAFPLSIIMILFNIIDIDPFALSHVVSDRAFIEVSILRNKPAFAMRVTFHECPIEIRPILEEKLTYAMRLFIEPLSFVDVACRQIFLRGSLLASLSIFILNDIFIQSLLFGDDIGVSDVRHGALRVMVGAWSFE